MKRLLGFLSIVMCMCSVTFANQATVGSNMIKQEPTSFFTESQCVDGSPYYHTWHYYVGDNFRLIDTHQGDNDYYHIYDDSTIVYVKDPYNVFNFSNNNNFQFKSNGKWKGVNAVIFVEKFGSFKKGSLPAGGYNGTFAGQIAFHLARATYEPGGSTRRYISYFPYPNGPQTTKDKKLKATNDAWGQIHGGLECFNYAVHYCGDGVIDTQASIAAFNNYGSNIHGYTGSIANEQCDPEDPTHAGRGNGGCSDTCQPINVQNPQCSSTYNNQTQYTSNGNNWLNQNMNLCAIGSVTNFQVSWNPGGSRHFTWNCTAGGNSTDCLAYQQWCGDGKVESNHGEACDPADPTQAGWNGNGYSCNEQCQLVPPQTQQPQCSSTYNNQTQYTSNGNNWLNQNMNLCTIGFVSNFQYSWNPGHSRHFTWNCNNDGQSTGCLAYQQWCGDGKVESNHGEACDPADPTQAGRGNGGCSDSCQPINVQNPQCNSQYNGQTQYTQNSNPWLQNTPSLCTVGTVSGFNYSGTPRIFTWSCVTSGGSVPCTANQQRCGDGQLNGSEQCDYNDPTQAGWNGMQCNNSCQLYQPGSPVPYLLKEQKTGGMANFTTNQINVQIGETITYKVNFGNSGAVAATGKVWDILPPCTNYLTSSIHLPNGVTYNGPITGLVNNGNQYSVQYKDFLLQPGQGGYMLVQAQVRSGGTNGTTSCSNVTSYLNTGYFNLGGTTLQSQVIAVRPQAPNLVIQKELLTAGDMIAGSTVAYKVILKNIGNATYYNAYIDDVRPNALNYLTSSIVGVSNYEFTTFTDNYGAFHIKYYNFNLAAGRSAIVYLTGTLKQGFNTGEMTNCAMTSGAVDCEEFPLTPVPFIQKYQKIGNDTNPNSNGWTTDLLTVELGDFISYRIDFGNVGNTPATGEVKDILPNCVKFITGFLVGAYGVGPTYYPNAYNVREVTFTNIPLAAGQTAHMMVVGKIKQEDGCTGTYTYLNTGAFRFLGTVDWEYSTVEAERPNITDVKIEKTVDNATVSSGDVVTYTITYRNEGPEVLQSYTIVDYWPNDKLQFSGVVSPLTPQPDLSNLSNNMIRREFTTPLQVGYENKRQIIIQGIVR